MQKSLSNTDDSIPTKSFVDITKRSPFEQLGKDILVYAPTKIVPSVIGILSVSLYTRLLAPREYGEFSLVIVTVSFVNALAFAWTGYVLLRYFERYKNKYTLHVLLSTLLFTILLLWGIISLAWLGLVIFLKPLWESSVIYLFQLGIFSVGTQALYAFILTLSLLDRQSLRYNAHIIFNTLGSFLLTLALIHFFSLRAESILLSIIFCGSISLLAEVPSLVKKRRIHLRFFSVPLLRQSVIFGLPQAGISISAMLLSVFDRYLIEIFRGSAAVGIYSASYKVAEMSLLFPLSIISLVATPLIIRTFENQGEEETQELLTNIFALYLLIFAPATLLIWYYSSVIVSLVLGTSFASAASILPPVAIGVFLFGFSQFENMPFQLKERPLSLFYLISLSGVVNILLNLGLIPVWGELGAAWATCLSYAVYTFVSYIYVNKLFRLVFPKSTVLKMTVALLGMLLVLVPYGSTVQTIPQFLARVVVASGVYLFILIILKEQMFQLFVANALGFRRLSG